MKTWEEKWNRREKWSPREWASRHRKLEIILLKAHVVNTIEEAQEWIKKGLVLVNGERRTLKTSTCDLGDHITWREKTIKKNKNRKRRWQNYLRRPNQWGAPITTRHLLINMKLKLITIIKLEP